MELPVSGKTADRFEVVTGGTSEGDPATLAERERCAALVLAARARFPEEPRVRAVLRALAAEIRGA